MSDPLDRSHTRGAEASPNDTARTLDVESTLRGRRQLKTAGYSRSRAASLLRGTHSLDVDTQKTAEYGLADAHHRANSLDVLGAERAGREAELDLTHRITLLNGNPAAIVSRDRSRAATIFAPFGVSFELGFIGPSLLPISLGCRARSRRSHFGPGRIALTCRACPRRLPEGQTRSRGTTQRPPEKKPTECHRGHDGINSPTADPVGSAPPRSWVESRARHQESNCACTSPDGAMFSN